MTFFLHKGGVFSCLITHTQLSNMLHLAHMLGTCTLISSSFSSPFHSSSQPHHVPASLPSPGANPPERRRVVRKNTGPSKYGRVKLNHLHMHQGSPLLHCRVAFTIIALFPTLKIINRSNWVCVESYRLVESSRLKYFQDSRPESCWLTLIYLSTNLVILRLCLTKTYSSSVESEHRFSVSESWTLLSRPTPYVCDSSIFSAFKPLTWQPITSHAPDKLGNICWLLWSK